MFCDLEKVKAKQHNNNNNNNFFIKKKIKAAVKLYRNGDPAMAMVCEVEERAEKLGHSSLVKTR